MDARKAYELVLNVAKNCTLKKCIEYSSVYVFVLEPNGTKNIKDIVKIKTTKKSEAIAQPKDTKKSEAIALPSYSVNKTTGKVALFNPMSLPIEEFRSGNVIKIAMQ